jgi:hypothetical protein
VSHISAASCRVDVIFHGGRMPPGNPIPHIIRGIKTLDGFPHLGMVAVVGTRTTSNVTQEMIRRILSTFGVPYDRTAHSFASLEEARATIVRDRKQTSVA